MNIDLSMHTQKKRFNFGRYGVIYNLMFSLVHRVPLTLGWNNLG